MLSKVSYNVFFTFFVSLMLSSGSVFAAFYKWVDENGNTHYSDVAPKEIETKAQKIDLEPMNRIQGFDVNRGDSSKESVVDKKGDVKTVVSNLVQTDNNAFKCFGPSPKTSNTVLERKPLQESEYQNLLSLFGNMKGRWKGEAVVTICKGTGKKPNIELNKYDTTSEFRLRRSRELIADFDMYSSKLRKSIDENIKLFLTEEQLTFSPSQSDETVALHLSDNVIELWVEQHSFHGTRKELVRTFKLLSNKMEVGQYSYSNGELESSTRWSLSKR